ncbi:unnamed protein product [Withania somnifera]
MATQYCSGGRRNLNDWEVKRVARLLSYIEAFTGLTNVPDTIRWKYNNNGLFSVNRNIWENIAPAKVRCFSWLVVRRACLTQEVLQKKI